MARLGLTQGQETRQEARLMRGDSGLHSGLNAAPRGHQSREGPNSPSIHILTLYIGKKLRPSEAWCKPRKATWPFPRPLLPAE